jgi:hypothetical protein
VVLVSWLAARWPGFAPIGWAVALAVLSTGCYATSAVLQEREAARPGPEGAARLLRLLRMPRWWLAVLATLAAAGLHVAALGLGPLSLIQPLGVLSLVFALPLGARLAGRMVSRGEWVASGWVALGLAGVGTVIPGRAPPVDLSVGVVAGIAGVVGVGAAALTALAGVLPHRGGAVVRAAAAATCFALASCMARMILTGAAPFWVGAAFAVLGAAAGFAMSQLAYRSGGLGAPLATLILLDPLVAVVLGVTVLREQLRLAPVPIALGLAGVVLTSRGIWILAQAPHTRTMGDRTEGNVTRRVHQQMRPTDEQHER